MLTQRVAVSAIFAAAIVASPISPARAEYYPVCTPNPLSWPFCVVGAAAGAAATIVQAPFGGPYGYYGSSAAPRGYVAGDGYEPWNRPSPTDHVARQLNRQELARTY